MIRLVIFDVAGTTVMDGDLVIDVMVDALASESVRVDREWVRSRMGLPKPLAIRDVLTRLSVADPAELDRMTDRIHQTFLERLAAGYRDHPDVREAPGASELFRTLREKNIRVSLDTGFYRPTLDVLLERLGWNAGLLDCTVTSDEVTRGRPSPYMIRRAMQIAGVDDSHAVMKVGDTPADVESGRAADCRAVVAVTYGTHSRAELEPYGPTHIIDALPEVMHLIEELSRP